jgi:hypothetical protein
MKRKSSFLICLFLVISSNVAFAGTGGASDGLFFIVSVIGLLSLLAGIVFLISFVFKKICFIIDLFRMC